MGGVYLAVQRDAMNASPQIDCILSFLLFHSRSIYYYNLKVCEGVNFANHSQFGHVFSFAIIKVGFATHHIPFFFFFF